MTNTTWGCTECGATGESIGACPGQPYCPQGTIPTPERPTEAPADDPEADGTDLAHPAYWRGEQHGIAVTIHFINRVLDEGLFKDFAYAPLQELTERVAALRTPVIPALPSPLEAQGIAGTREPKHCNRCGGSWSSAARVTCPRCYPSRATSGLQEGE